MKKWGIKKIIKSVYLRLFALVSILLFFIVLILLGSSTVYSDTSNTNNSSRVETNLNDSPTPAVKPPFAPSPPSTKYFGLWYFVACYIQQPKADYYAKVGENVTIHTKIGRNSQSDWYGSDKHTIHQTDIDTGKWSSIDNGSNSDYTLTSDKPGTIYIQDETQVYPTQFNLHPIYSKMAAVHFTPEKAGPAEKIEITADDDTFYVDDVKGSKFTITARADITPDNSIDSKNLRWTSSDTSLAAIDPISGKITVDGAAILNNPSKTDFTINAIIDGENSIKAAKTFQIKKILTGPDHIYDGQDAYFHLHGPIAEQQNNINITWMYELPGHPHFPIKGQLEDNAVVIDARTVHQVGGGVLYGAIKKTVNGETTYTRITNKAPFNKLKNLPIITRSQSIYLYKTRIDSSSSNSTVQDVSVGDTLLHHITLKNISDTAGNGAKINQKGNLKLTISTNESVLRVIKTDQENPIGKVLNEGRDYNVSKSDGQDMVDVNLRLPKDVETSIDIYTKVDKVIAESANYAPVYTIDNFIKNNYRVDFKDNFASFNKSNIESGALSLHPQNIDYKAVNGSSQKYINRVSPGENENILTFDDTRSNKTSVKILLTYFNKFVKPPDTDFITPFIFEYFDENGNVVQAPDNTVILKTTTYGKTPDPIKWKIDRGLKIKTTGDSIPSGTYRTVLIWSVTDSIS